MVKVTNSQPKKYTVDIIRADSGKMPRLLYRLLANASPSGKEDIIRGIIRNAIKSYDKDADIVQDKVGNLIYEIGVRGKDHNTLFSAHMDTVHSDLTTIHIGLSNKNFPKGEGYVCGFNRDKDGTYSQTILGADDKIGIYILLQLIKKRTPGLYIFHVSEERGGLGSKYIADNTPDVVKDIKRAIAFDRRGTTDVIGSQRGSVCCSSDFGKALAARLNTHMPPKNQYKEGAIGSFTDTASYMGLIPECTNISCGYYNEHTDTECFDLFWYDDFLLPTVLDLDWETLPTVRDPKAVVSRVSWRRTDYGEYETYNSSFDFDWKLSLEKILACKNDKELEEKLNRWVTTAVITDFQKQLQLKAFVTDVLEDLGKTKSASQAVSVDKELLTNYLKLMNEYITALASDIASNSDVNKPDEAKIEAVYSNYELINSFVKDHDPNDPTKPSLEELLVLCVDYMFICLKIAGEIKIKSSGMIDVIKDIIAALVLVRSEKTLKVTTYKKTVKIPAVQTNGSYRSMPIPCVKKCGYNGVYGMCSGCNRTEEEKRKWYQSTTEEQKGIWYSTVLRGIAFPELNPEQKAVH